LRRIPSILLIAVFALAWAADATFATDPMIPASVKAPAPVTPEAKSNAAQVAAIQADLTDLTRDRLFRESKVGLTLVDLDTGQVVFSHGEDTSLMPASTMKVLTAAAALRELGPSYRFATRVYTDGKLSADGVLDGNLYVRGGGDPTMVIEKLWKLVYDLKLDGVKEIKGDIVFDDSFFDDRTRISGWASKKDLERGPAYFAPIGALSLNFNTVALVLRPGEKIGDPAVAALETPAPGVVEIESELVTGSKRSQRNVGLERIVDGRKVTFKVTGSLPVASESVRYYRSIADPTAYFMSAFAAQVQSQGIKVRGGYEEGEVPKAAKVFSQMKSSPLATILMDMNKYSSNFIAEQVLKTLGAGLRGDSGSTLKGLDKISDYLKSLGIPEKEYVLVNGSGLSRRISLRPNHLTAVLVDMAADGKVSPEFMASLAIGGRDGTLWSRFRDEKQVDRLRGKTGTINGVHCLAGYIQGPTGKSYAFAYLVNNLRGGIARARKAHDKFVSTLLDRGQNRSP